MLLLIRRVAHPLAWLGRVPGTHRFSDIERHPDNERVPGVLIVRVESSLLYFNVSHVSDQLWRHVAACGDELRRVVWDLSTSPYVDIAGARLLSDIQRALAPRSVVVRIVEAHSSVRDLIRAELGMSVGEINRRIVIDDAIVEPPGAVTRRLPRARRIAPSTTRG